MTAIVGFTNGEKCWIGADSAGSSGSELSIRADRKVFVNGEWLFGFTSSYRMGQLLQYSFVPPPVPHGVEMHRFMSTVFIDAVRKCLKDGGYATILNNLESAGAFLVARGGWLFQVDSDYQVGQMEEPYDAVGCGSAVAIGAMHALCTFGPVSAKSKVSAALAAAERHCNGVRSPFYILETPELKATEA